MHSSDQYELIDGSPDVADYVRLRTLSGLSPKTEEQARGAIAGSWSFRHVRDETGQTVAMGRVVGDGTWYFLIADMATLPEHQGRGLGGKLLDALLGDIRRLAPEGAYVTLTADPPGRRLYESRGFSDVAPDRTGMHLVIGTSHADEVISQP
ncbi:GNAT family N-acetyltransferase [Subtercola boreus]|uniref:GNAT family N-acetyltransferase n=1 Tax=Subtercola boreus TaxID=120213 RepID=A0A3E0W7G9_9MICO|nr:GNAT family N-acetyltransferase [Subtercola boreus]RFA17570.1 GNAT family N-acetyltransferase [Subtercola boreus]RFA17706.1 GNAT family N-acetyltransferase [Subtercola boreus]RFA24214.1 GNAT family N-acetyltransferase [Subtercola boreus]